MASMMFLDDLRETQQLRAELETRAPRRLDTDREPHLAVFDEQAGDATELDEAVAVTDGEHRRTLERVEQLRRALGVQLRDIQHVARAATTPSRRSRAAPSTW